MTAAVAPPARRHWSFALFGALLLHAGLALVFHQMMDTGTLGAGRAGIEVGLGPAGGAPGEAGGDGAAQQAAEVLPEAVADTPTNTEAVAVEAPPEAMAPVIPSETATASAPPPVAEAALPQAATVPEAVPLYAPVERVPAASESAPLDAVAVEPPPEVVEAAPAELPEVDAADSPGAEVLPVEAVEAVEAPAQTVAAEPAMPVPAVPRAKPTPPQLAASSDPRQIEPQPFETSAAAPAPVAAIRESEVPPETAVTEAAAAAEASNASAATTQARSQGTSDSAQSGTDGKAGTGARTASGTTESRGGGGNPGAVVDYATRLNAWLQKHQEYPRRARLRRQEGVATLYFVIDRGGRLLDFRVEKGTGYKLLDEEVIATIKRAAPLPAPPEGVVGDTLEYRIPVVFDQH